MTQEVKQRIEQIRRGEVPEGYVKTRAGIMPLDWEVNVPAKAVFKNHSDKKHNGQFEVLSATQDRGIIPRNEVDIDIKYDEGGIDSYKKVEKGDFVISLRSFQGGIEYSEYDGLVSPAYTVLKAKKPIYPGYYRAYFKTVDFINRLNGAVYGIRDGKQIGYEDFGDLIIHYPPLEEQKKIAQVLDACDRVIELKQKLLDELKKLKKVRLEKMFPQKGNSVPEIRFSDFTGSWDYYKLSRLMDFSNGFNGDASLYGRGIPYISVVDILNNKYITYQCIQGKVDIDEKSITKYAVGYGDVLFQRCSENVEEAGSSNVYISDQTVAFGGFVIRGKRKAEYDAYYMKNVLDSSAIRSQIVSRAQGAQHINISQETLMGVHINIPSLDEQKKIGRFFLDTDDLIALYQKELEEEQRKKKALMQLLLTGIVRAK